MVIGKSVNRDLQWNLLVFWLYLKKLEKDRSCANICFSLLSPEFPNINFKKFASLLFGPFWSFSLEPLTN